MPTFGVYPVADALTAGDEVSSTYEGRHVTLIESDLIHKAANAGNLVISGDAVVFGTIALQGVGVAFTTATAATDLVAIDTEGIWILPVLPYDDDGQIAVEGGDRLYISITTAIISKIASAATNVPFGYALGHVDAGATAKTIAVKVHWDPIDNAILDNEPFFFGDAREVSLTFKDASMCGSTAEILELDCLAVPALSSAFQIKAVGVAGTQDVGIAAYFDASIGGQSTGNWVYGTGLWLNLLTTFDESAGGWGGHEQITPLSLGIYGTTLTDGDGLDIIYGAKCEYIMTTTPVHGVYAFALNVAGATVAAAHTAIFFAMQNEAIGLGANMNVQAGSVALACVNGVMYYVNVYSS